MRPGTRRALLGIVSVSAVLLPALGITYLGVMSYASDAGEVARKVDEQLRITQTVAGEVEARLGEALADAERVLAAGEVPEPEDLAALAERHPAASLPFRISAAGTLSWPRPRPLEGAISESALPGVRGARACPENEWDRCVRELRAARRRNRQLVRARRNELRACATARCVDDDRALARARRLYATLSRYSDTGPSALLGLARLGRAGERVERASGHLRELRRRFAGRQDQEGVSYALLGDLGLARIEDDRRRLLDVLERLLDNRYVGRSEALLAVARHLRDRLEGAELAPEPSERRASLVQRVDQVDLEVRFARAMLAEVDDVARSAGPKMRGRLAVDNSGRTVVYRRTEQGDVIGMMIGREQIATIAQQEAVGTGRLGSRRWVEVHPLGSLPDERTTRTLATASFGPALAHFSVSLVNNAGEPDPLDEIVDTRGQRHLWITGGLAIVLVIGIVATIRNAARERELARLKSDFVSTVSHELKTPLTSVRMFAEMLQQGVARGDRGRESRYHEIIVKESERLGLLIANLLDYSQVERGTRRYSEQRVAMSELVRDSVSTFARFQDEPSEIDVVDSSDAAVARVDREVIVQCVLNLLSNASKYGEGRPIDVEVWADDTEVGVSVRDRGPGIPRSEIGKIWDEFYRSPSAYSSGVEGTGLGLALVKRHVEAQDGRVSVDSVTGEGATFVIALPRVAAPAKEAA